MNKCIDCKHENNTCCTSPQVLANYQGLTGHKKEEMGITLARFGDGLCGAVGSWFEPKEPVIPRKCKWCGEYPLIEQSGNGFRVACRKFECGVGPKRPTKKEANEAWNEVMK